MRVTLGVLALLAVAAAARPAELDLSEAKRVVVLHGGRKKPLDSLCRERVRTIFEEERVDGRDPVETVLSILVDRDTWWKRAFLEVEDAEVAKRYFHGARRITPADVASHGAELQQLVHDADRMQQALKRAGPSAPSEMRRQAKRLARLREAVEPILVRVQALMGVESSLRIVPTDDPHGTWLTVAGAERDDVGAAVRTAWASTLDAFEKGDARAFLDASRLLRVAQRALRPAAMPSETVIDLEVLFYAAWPYTAGLILFALVSALFLVRAFARSRLTLALAMAGLVLGVLWNTWVVAMYTLFAHRLPLRNVHEVFLVVIWFVPVIGLLLQAILRSVVYGALGAALALVGWIGFHGLISAQPDGIVIRPLVAILDSGWREIHILSIMLSYAIMLVAFGIHVAYLVARLREGRGHEPGESARALDEQAYHVLAWGFLFLTIGIATGAAWAQSSWGRYWGWDSKEVWATVAWGIYAVFLHMRLFWKMRGGWLTAINFLGFGAIVFTYFGVTYLLPGLHSYGAS